MAHTHHPLGLSAPRHPKRGAVAACSARIGRDDLGRLGVPAPSAWSVCLDRTAVALAGSGRLGC
jgi:hypothetical protein